MSSSSTQSDMELTNLERELGEFSITPQHTDRAVVTVISGPSGVGKDAAIRALQETRPDIHFVVTATREWHATRPHTQLTSVLARSPAAARCGRVSRTAWTTSL